MFFRAQNIYNEKTPTAHLIFQTHPVCLLQFVPTYVEISVCLPDNVTNFLLAPEVRSDLIHRGV